MKRQSTALLLLLAMTSAATVSCGDSSETTPDTTASAVTAETAVTTETPETELVNWQSAGLEKKDFGGDEFVILTRDTANHAHAWYLIAPEETTGEILNDSMVDRNHEIENVFNIKIKSLYEKDCRAVLSKAVTAGDTSYDCVLSEVRGLCSLAREGKLVNWYDLPHIDLKAQWWDKSVIDQLTYHDTLYYCTGDISPATNTRVYSLVFNKDMCRALGLEMPYQYVLDGKWTMDVFNQYISDVNSDMNGDGVMDYSDRWGYFSQDGNSFMMYFAGGGTVVEQDKNGEFILTYNTDRNIELAAKAVEISIDKTKTLMANQYVNDHGGQWSEASKWFAAGGALMRSSVFEPVPRDYRSMETDFGVLPYPKFDESQETYYTVAEETSIMISVPITSDTEFVGLILEAMAAQSVSTVTPAYYDKCLNGKSVRDDESSAMLDILFENKVFDYGLIADISNIKTMLTGLETKNSTDVASAFAKAEKAAVKNLEKLANDFDEHS